MYVCMYCVDYFSRDVEVCSVYKSVNTSQIVTQLKKDLQQTRDSRDPLH